MCRPVSRGWLGWGGYNTDCVLRAVLSVCRGVTTGQHITWSICGGGVCNTDCVVCRPVCRGWLGWGGGLQHRPRVTCRPVCMQGGYNRTAHNMVYLWGGGLQHRLCCVPSCLSGLVRVGWGVTTQTACYVPSCLSGLVTTQTACYVPSCLYAGGLQQDST